MTRSERSHAARARPRPPASRSSPSPRRAGRHAAPGRAGVLRQGPPRRRVRGADGHPSGQRADADALPAAGPRRPASAGCASPSRASAPGSPRAPAASRYVYTKTVDGLVGPASYRVVVHFRWLAADGTVLRRATVRLRRVPPARPAPRSLGLRARGAPGAARPRGAATRSRSPTPAARPRRRRRSRSTWATAARRSAPPSVRWSGRGATVVVTGRACVPGALLTAAADATDVVDERDEDDDTFALSCPAPAA